MNNEEDKDNDAEIDLGPEDDALGSAAYKQDEGWHDALDEDENDEDEDAKMENDKQDDDEENDDDAKDIDDDDDNDKSSDSHSSDDSTDDSSNNSTVTPPAENKETSQSPKNTQTKAGMITATSGQGNTNGRANIGYQDNAADVYLKPMVKSSKKIRMTTKEARRHTKDSIEACKKAINERTAKKMALKRQTAAATDTIDASISPSTPKRKCTQQQSPGGTPDNDQRLQWTGTAPERPSTEDELARALDFKSQDENILTAEATTGNHGEAMQHQ
jgi:hypothetical protein